MKELFLSESQIKKIVNGKGVVISRSGQQFLVAPKSLKHAQTETQKIEEKKARLIAQLKELSAARSHKKSRLMIPMVGGGVCDKCKKWFARPDLHKALKHEGRLSNLPQVRKKQARENNKA